jgi:hypothetical protein
LHAEMKRDDFAEKEEPHDPVVIRKWFIIWLRRAGLTLSNELIKADAHQPWTNHKTFKDVLDKLKSDIRVANQTVSEILGPNFNTRLELYLTVLRQIAPPSTQSTLLDLARAVHDIETGPLRTDQHRNIKWSDIRFGGKVESFENIYKSLPTLFNESFKEFLGLCLFLSIASKDSVTRAANVGLGVAPFDSLKLK